MNFKGSRIPPSSGDGVPEAAAEFAVWLEQQLLESDLGKLADRLEYVYAMLPAPLLTVHEVLGQDLIVALEKGFSALPAGTLSSLRRQVLSQPASLFALQELVFVDGKAFWQERLLQVVPGLDHSYDEVLARTRSELETRITGRKRKRPAKPPAGLTDPTTGRPAKAASDTDPDLPAIPAAGQASPDDTARAEPQPIASEKAASPSGDSARRPGVLGRVRQMTRRRGVALVSILGLGTIGMIVFVAGMQSQRVLHKTRADLDSQRDALLGQVHQGYGDAHLGQEWLRRAVVPQEKLVVRWGDPSSRRVLAELNHLLGMMYVGNGQLEDALKTAHLSVAHAQLLERLHADAGANSYHTLAAVQARLGQDREAEKTYQRAIRSLTGSTGTVPAAPDKRWTLAVSWMGLAEILALTDRMAEADDAYAQAREFLERLVQEYPEHAGYGYDLVRCFVNAGQVLVMTDRKQQAEDSCRRALLLAEKLKELQTPQLAHRHLVAGCHLNLGYLLHLTGRLAEAQCSYEAAAKLYEGLALDRPQSPQAQLGLGFTSYNLGELFIAGDQLAQSEPSYQKARELFADLVKRMPQVPFHQAALGLALTGLAQNAHDRGELDAAAQLTEQALEHLRAAHTGSSRNTMYRQWLLHGYRQRAVILLRGGRHAEAARMAAEFPAYAQEGWRDHCRAAIYLARCAGLAEADASLPAAERRVATDIYVEQARTMLQTADARVDKDSAGLNELAWFFATCPMTQLRDGSKAVALARQAVYQDRTDGHYWNTLGVAYYRTSCWRDAVDALTHSAELRQGGDSSDWFFLGMAHWQLGNQDKARRQHVRAVQWMKQRKPHDEELVRFEAESARLLGLEREYSAVDRDHVRDSTAAPR